MLSKVTHPDDATATEPFWAQVWDGLFDVYAGGHVNSPEELGPILRDELGLDVRAATTP
jgi:hypothetical protein